MRTFKTIALSLLSLPAVVIVGACTGVPDGVEVVEGFELDRYLGTWHEIARLNHRFERGLTNVTATYSLRADGGVDVVNRGYRAKENTWDEATGKAYFLGGPDVGRLKVSFAGPFYGAYNIIELDKVDYQYSLVVGPTRSYLWILSRSPELDPGIVSALVARAAALGFPTDELIMVDHSEGSRIPSSERDASPR
jgi:apolipoprotein D and lipocalin family protein